jgi:hypothetical protein
MSLQALIPPQDITWTRLSYSRDMIDTNSIDSRFPVKWRSSMAIYYYKVPDEDTVDSYPNSRIVYLKMTCSITGWNPFESLYNWHQVFQESEKYDDLQKSVWDAIMGTNWGSTYWACVGAIMQVGVYPNGNNISVDDYPYIMDFEPKKREFYEPFTEGSEKLSASSDMTSVTKGSTSVSNTELNGIGENFPVIGGGFSITGSLGGSTTNIDQKVTDTSREARETISRTASSSQMYQLFNGYHLGTNRALFVVAPRPHIAANQEQTEFNLIHGQRKLEGIQEVFLVVHIPHSLNGFCVQATLDTGHNVSAIVPEHLVSNHVFRMKPGVSNPPDDPTMPPPSPENSPVNQILVTQRIIKSCGKFDDNGNYTIMPTPDLSVNDDVSNEIAIAKIGSATNSGATIPDRESRIETANFFNQFQKQVMDAMISGMSSGKYKKKQFIDTSIFKSLAAATVTNNSTPLSKLFDLKYISKQEFELLAKNNIKTVGQLFLNSANKISEIEIGKIRERILTNKLTEN